MNNFVLLFDQILEMSLTASIAVIAVLLIRLALIRFPKKYSYWLWMVVLFRLLCPISIGSAFSIFNFVRYWSNFLERSDISPPSSEVEFLPNEQITTTAIPAMNGETASEQTAHTYASEETSYIPMETITSHWWKVAALIWIAGIAIFLGYSLYQYVRLHKRVKRATLLRHNIYECENISSPFVMGLFSPRIYLPYGLEKRKQDFILTHEKYHIRRGDHLIKLIAFLALGLHWFNPLVWISWFFLQRDMEMSCDEKVVSLLGNEFKKEYSSLLLSFSTNQRPNLGGPLAFGESDTEKRIKNILHFHQPGRLAAVLGIFLLAFLILGFGTSEVPSSDGGSSTGSKEGLLFFEETQVTEGRTGGVPGTDSNTTSDYMSPILVMEPVIDLDATTGADGYFVYYADEHRIIFGGYFGLFVYSKDEERLIRSVDLEPIGCNYTQGDSYCEIFVSEDGETVYLHPIDYTGMYVYEVTNNSLFEIAYDLTGVELYDGLTADGSATYMTPEGPVSDLMRGQYGTLGDIGYTDENGLNHYLLLPPLYTDTVYFEPEDITNLVMAEMTYENKVYRTTNKEALAYIEEYFSTAFFMGKEASACPFYDKMYLTRADGTVGIIYPATDSCASFRTPTGDYDYLSGDNSELWNFFPGISKGE